MIKQMTKKMSKAQYECMASHTPAGWFTRLESSNRRTIDAMTRNGWIVDVSNHYHNMRRYQITDAGFLAMTLYARKEAVSK